MNNAQISHAWAHQTKPQGKGSNLFFDEDTIYSYGYHFPIAKKVNAGTILFTTRDYSNTTAKHKSIVNRAIPSAWVTIYVPHFRKCNDNLTYFEEEFKTLIEKYKNSRKFKDALLGCVQRHLENFQAYCAYFEVSNEDFSESFKTLLETIQSKSFEETIEERQSRLERIALAEKKRQAKELVALFVWISFPDCEESKCGNNFIYYPRLFKHYSQA